MYAWIFPTSRSVALQTTDPPPEFEVVTDRSLNLIVEVTTNNSLFDAQNQRQRNPAGGMLNFYNSSQGLPAQGIAGQQLRTPPSNRISFSVPAAIWADFVRSERIYYRVIAFHQFNQGQPVGQLFYSTKDRDFQSAPYIHVMLPMISPFYNRSTRPSSRQKTPWLMVDGNRLIEGRRRQPPANAQAKPEIVLRGVNFSGLQYREPTWGTPEGQPSTRWREAAGITQARIQEIADWGAKIIRLPINQDWVLNGLTGYQRNSPYDGVEYLKDIDQIIDWAASAGMYILLDLQVLDKRPSSGRKSDWTQPMPDNLSLLFWRILAGRYRSDPAVLYDLCNEPHKPLKDDWATYRGYQPPKDSGWIELWHEWVRQIEGVIHQTHWDAVIFVSGIGGPCLAASLRSMPVPMPPFHVKNPRHIPNAVYSCHIYYHLKDDGDGVDDSSGKKMGTVNPDHWTYWFGFERLRKNCPIFIGEFGAEPEDFDRNFTSNPNPSATQQAINQKAINDMLKWGWDLTAYLSTLRKKQNGQWPGLAGWTAWSWGDEPHLVERATGTSQRRGDRPYQMNPANPQVHALTDFGALVKFEISKP